GGGLGLRRALRPHTNPSRGTQRIGVARATRRYARHWRRLLRLLIRLLAVPGGPLTGCSVQTWRRLRRFVIRIWKSPGAPAHVAGRWRKILLVVIASDDGRQTLLVLGLGWPARGVLRKCRRSHQSHPNWKCEQESSGRSDHYPPWAANQPPEPGS